MAVSAALPADGVFHPGAGVRDYGGALRVDPKLPGKGRGGGDAPEATPAAGRGHLGHAG